jgi:hypothetical protein
MNIVRVILALAIFLASCCFAADPTPVALRGKLIQEERKAPALETGGKRVVLEGDEPTLKVLNDDRLRNADIEVMGHAVTPDRFAVDHIHTNAIYVYREGKRLQVSYWCDVCYIRTSSPGKCWCCQKNTDLDPVEPEH